MKIFKENTIEKTGIALVSIYIFLSGFVYFEPSPAEYFIIVAILPFAILYCTFKYIDMWVILILVIIDLSGLYIIITMGWFNFSYLLIDIYLFGSFLLLCSILRNLKLETYIDIFMTSWTIAGLVNVLACLYCHITGTNEIFGITIFYGLRWRGFFKDSNVLGPFLVAPFLYWVYYFIAGKRNLFISLICLLLLSIGTFLSFSRAAWLNTFTGFLVLFLLLPKIPISKALFKLSLLIFSLVILGSILLLSPEFNNLTQARLGLQSYDKNRFAAQAAILKILPSNPFFGIGCGNYSRVTLYATHSLYIRTMGEHGLIGIITVFTMLTTATIVFLKIRRVYPFLLAAFCGILVNSFFIDTWHWRHLWILLAIAFSLYPIFPKLRSKTNLKNNPYSKM